MSRMSIEKYLAECDNQTQRFNPSQALEIVIRTVPADPATSDPSLILEQKQELEQEVAYLRYLLLLAKRAKNNNVAQKQEIRKRVEALLAVLEDL